MVWKAIRRSLTPARRRASADDCDLNKAAVYAATTSASESATGPVSHPSKGQGLLRIRRRSQQQKNQQQKQLSPSASRRASSLNFSFLSKSFLSRQGSMVAKGSLANTEVTARSSKSYLNEVDVDVGVDDVSDQQREHQQQQEEIEDNSEVPTAGSRTLSTAPSINTATGPATSSAMRSSSPIPFAFLQDGCEHEQEEGEGQDTRPPLHHGNDDTTTEEETTIEFFSENDESNINTRCARRKRSSSKTMTPLTERDVYDFVWEYTECFTQVAQHAIAAASAHSNDKKNTPTDSESISEWNGFWTRYHTEDYLLIRPSGNSLDRFGLKTMFETGDISEFCDDVLAVESIKLLGPNIAVAVYKTEQSFVYKGSQNEDFCTWTAVIVKDAQSRQLQITNIHRSTGRNIKDCVISSAE